MVLSNKRIIKALIRLRGCTGWSAPLLFANPEDRFSSSRPIFDYPLLSRNLKCNGECHGSCNNHLSQHTKNMVILVALNQIFQKLDIKHIISLIL